jgi:hypothetical protein
MLAGAVPLVNQPLKPMETPLEHGRNCFLYPDTVEGLVKTVEEALRNEGQLREMAEQLPSEARRDHAVASVARIVEAGLSIPVTPAGP